MSTTPETVVRTATVSAARRAEDLLGDGIPPGHTRVPGRERAWGRTAATGGAV
ncbi:hypothetical protein [Streptomyces chiangmaiensis]|uniref:Uncharacterized protein n=1 Tax=Streptomyces chiangmaiensis TaxID=766497 RepID=A0ABU7FGS0_9ACTN|nr:hypothetical protein [Streptomyces chiangmaiensis]MED7822354.1 hypothetical protein [Streptomyces chiangmaiensis]